MTMTLTSPLPTFVPQALEQIDALTANRSAALRVAALIADGGSTAGDIADAVQLDAALTARLMRLGNSPYYGMSGRVRDAKFAVMIMGFNTVRSLALLDAVEGGLQDQSAIDYSLTMAAAVGEIALRHQIQPSDLVCAGMMASLGRIALRGHDQDGYDAMLATNATYPELAAAELGAYGITSPEIAAAALERWQFPQELTEMLRDAARPATEIPTQAEEVLRESLAVATAISWLDTRLAGISNSGSIVARVLTERATMVAAMDS